MTKFMVDTSVSYNEVEGCFFKGPRGKDWKSLNIWIKMLFVKNKLCSYLDVQSYVKWKDLQEQRDKGS